jgi:hypothetical protein
MHRFAVLAAAGIAVAMSGMSSADAAARHKHKIRAVPPVAQHAPADVQPAFINRPTFANRPTWAAPQQCYTNDGYGRFLPCDIGDGR